jgi:hypothetical protein
MSQTTFSDLDDIVSRGAARGAESQFVGVSLQVGTPKSGT